MKYIVPEKRIKRIGNEFLSWKLGNLKEESDGTNTFYVDESGEKVLEKKGQILYIHRGLIKEFYKMFEGAIYWANALDLIIDYIRDVLEINFGDISIMDN